MNFAPSPRQRAALAAGLAVGATVVAGVVLQDLAPPASLSLFFVIPVLGCAAAFGAASGLLSAVLSFLAFNFFFVAPKFTFQVADPREAIVLLALLLVASITGALAGRLRAQTINARARAERLQRLYAYSADLAAATTGDDIWKAVVTQASAIVAGEAVVLGIEGDGVAILAAEKSRRALDPADLALAERCIRRKEPMLAAAPGWQGARLEFRPIVTARGGAAALGLSPGDGSRVVAREDEESLAALLRHAAITLDRLAFENETAAARTLAEQERLRSALLSSVSHDLRTPLATILGSVTSLRQLGTDMDAAARDDLLAAIEEETRRLSRFVTDLLAMTRIEAGVEIPTDWIDAADVARAAVGRARRAFPSQTFVLSAGPGPLLIRAEPVLLEQALFNLLDNAARFAPLTTPIEINALACPTSVEIAVTDHGPGVPAEERELIFDRFYRGEGSGAGIGLAICRKVVETLGGAITLESPLADGPGARFTIRLPAPGPETRG